MGDGLDEIPGDDVSGTVDVSRKLEVRVNRSRHVPFILPVSHHVGAFDKGVTHDGSFQIPALELGGQKIHVEENVVINLHHVTGRTAKPGGPFESRDSFEGEIIVSVDETKLKNISAEPTFRIDGSL